MCVRDIVWVTRLVQLVQAQRYKNKHGSGVLRERIIRKDEMYKEGRREEGKGKGVVKK